MKPFLIRVGPRGAPRLSFACMSADSFTAFDQHADLADRGERVEVLPVRRGDSFDIKAARHALETARIRESLSGGAHG